VKPLCDIALGWAAAAPASKIDFAQFFTLAFQSQSLTTQNLSFGSASGPLVYPMVKCARLHSRATSQMLAARSFVGFEHLDCLLPLHADGLGPDKCHRLV
jgi:hypothetical protein